MANMKIINDIFAARYPTLDIEIVRGKGYIYFDGPDGFDKIESINVNLTTITTEKLIPIVDFEICSVYKGGSL